MSIVGFICFIAFGVFGFCIGDNGDSKLALIALGAGCLFWMGGIYLDSLITQSKCATVEVFQNETPAMMTQGK